MSNIVFFFLFITRIVVLGQSFLHISDIYKPFCFHNSIEILYVVSPQKKKEEEEILYVVVSAECQSSYTHH